MSPSPEVVQPHRRCHPRARSLTVLAACLVTSAAQAAAPEWATLRVSFNLEQGLSPLVLRPAEGRARGPAVRLDRTGLFFGDRRLCHWSNEELWDAVLQNDAAPEGADTRCTEALPFVSEYGDQGVGTAALELYVRRDLGPSFEVLYRGLPYLLEKRGLPREDQRADLTVPPQRWRPNFVTPGPTATHTVSIDLEQGDLDGTWEAVCSATSGGFELAPVQVRLAELSSSEGLLRMEGCERPLFALRGQARRARPFRSASRVEQSGSGAARRVLIRFGDQRFTISRERSGLVVSAGGKSNSLGVLLESDAAWSVPWAGDLDGDGKLDVAVREVRVYETVLHLMLSLGHEGEAPAAQWPPDGC